MATNLQKVAYRWQHPEESYVAYLQGHATISRRRYLEKLLGRLDDADVCNLQMIQNLLGQELLHYNSEEKDIYDQLILLMRSVVYVLEQDPSEIINLDDFVTGIALDDSVMEESISTSTVSRESNRFVFEAAKYSISSPLIYTPAEKGIGEGIFRDFVTFKRKTVYTIKYDPQDPNLRSFNGRDEVNVFLNNYLAGRIVADEFSSRIFSAIVFLRNLQEKDYRFAIVNSSIISYSGEDSNTVTVGKFSTKLLKKNTFDNPDFEINLQQQLVNFPISLSWKDVKTPYGHERVVFLL